MINIYDFICANSTYFKQLKFDKDEKILIDYTCPLTGKQARAWSHKNCLMYVLQGSKAYSTSTNYHKSIEQQVLFIRKGGTILHQFFEKPYRALIFMFDDAALKSFFLEYPELLPDRKHQFNFAEQPTLSVLPGSDFVKDAFTSSLDYLNKPAMESQIALGVKFKELLINLLRNKSSNSFNCYLYTLCNAQDTAFIQLMHENSHYNFSVGEMARIACMSLSVFKRRFAEQFGISPGKWLREQRILKAIKLLSQKGKNISEISFELGYNDTAAFSKAFKKATGHNPSDYLEEVEPN